MAPREKSVVLTSGTISYVETGPTDGRVVVLRMVLTNCDAFDTFPPAPFDTMFRLARRPAVGWAMLQPLRVGSLRTSRLGFGNLADRRLSASETRPWVTAYLGDAGIRRDVASFARTWTGRELSGAAEWLSEFRKPVLLVWGAEDKVFGQTLATRLVDTFPDARLVRVDGAGTFVSLDDPARLAGEIAAFASS